METLGETILVADDHPYIQELCVVIDTLFLSPEKLKGVAAILPPFSFSVFRFRG